MALRRAAGAIILSSRFPASGTAKWPICPLAFRLMPSCPGCSRGSSRTSFSAWRTGGEGGPQALAGFVDDRLVVSRHMHAKQLPSDGEQPPEGVPAERGDRS